MNEDQQRQLGASGIAVPALGVGIWSWGDAGFWGYGQAYTREDIAQAYQFCLDSGLNFFDTAELYGRGASERLLGECKQQDDRPIIIASKFAPYPMRLSPRSLSEALDQSLKRLGVKQIDLYQIHWPYTLLKINDLMDAMAEAVKAGKIRAVGVSNYSADQMRKAHARLARHDIPLASNQVHYSLVHRQPEANGVLDACRELNVALIAYSPLEQGLLTGKYRPGNAQVSAQSFPRRMQANLNRRKPQKMEALFTVMESIAREHEKALGQVALNWLLTQDPCIIPIPGAKNLRQAKENADSLGWHLTEDQHARISEAAAPWLPRK
jgi:aryl-alcohol dehydrogenase-like predicted oxidoreductase